MRITTSRPVLLPAVCSLLLWGLATSAAVAQRVELTPFAGYRSGGGFEIRGVDDFGPFVDQLDLDDAAAYGLLLDLGLNRNFQLELGFSRQETDLGVDLGFLGPVEPLGRIDVDVWHLGLLYQWGRGQVRPFVVPSIGATSFDPVEPGFSSESRLSVGFGAGVKAMVDRHVGVRLEGRWVSTLIDANQDLFCDRFGYCYSYDQAETLDQVEVRGGLIIGF